MNDVFVRVIQHLDEHLDFQLVRYALWSSGFSLLFLFWLFTLWLFQILDDCIDLLKCISIYIDEEEIKSISTSCPKLFPIKYNALADPLTSSWGHDSIALTAFRTPGQRDAVFSLWELFWRNMAAIFLFLSWCDMDMSYWATLVSLVSNGVTFSVFFGHFFFWTGWFENSF